jgi:hypothetical protein
MRRSVSFRLRPAVGIALSVVALSLVGAPAAAMDWPLSPQRFAATFGTFGNGRAILGVALASEEGIVRSSEDGEIAFAVEEGAQSAGLPMPLGSFAVVEHQRGIAAVYSHFAPGTLATREKKLKAGASLGRPGRSGWIEGPGVLFQIFDLKAKNWVNPLLVLPPLADGKPPAIRSLALSRGGRTYVAGEVPSLPQGTYRVSVDVVDPADSPWVVGPLAPFSIRISIDGVEAAKYVFDIAKGTRGKLSLFAGTPVDAGALKTPEGRYILDERLFSRGRVAIEARAEDAAGNMRSASWALIVE